jgi:hypothetical protein
LHIKFPLALARIPSPLTRKHLCTWENIYCDSEHKKKSLSWPDADTSGTTEKEQYCINSRLHHIKTPSLNLTQYQRICVISLNPDNEPSPQTLQDSSSSETLSTLSYSINKKSLSEWKQENSEREEKFRPQAQEWQISIHTARILKAN